MGRMREYVETLSAQPCGCDPGEKHVCEMHTVHAEQERQLVIQTMREDQQPWVDKSTSLIGAGTAIRTFATGATRNDDTSKFDYEGFINPEALHLFGAYMHEHRRQRDGTIRAADNWQKGISFRVYMKSLVRHTIDLWRMDRGYTVINPDTGDPHTKRDLCCAIVFNALGYLKELVDPADINKDTP